MMISTNQLRMDNIIEEEIEEEDIL